MTVQIPSMVPTVENNLARVALLSATADTGAGAVAIEVQRSVDGGSTWLPVRGWSGNVADTDNAWTSTLHDHEAPGRGEVSYRARAIAVTNPSDMSAWSDVATIHTDVTYWWLADVAAPELGGRVRPEWSDVLFRAERDQGTFAVLGRSRAVVLTGVRRGEQITLTLLCFSDEEFWALDAALGAGTCLLRDDGGHAWYVVAGSSRDATLTATADRGTRPVRKVAVTFLEVDAPPVDDTI